MPRGRPFQPGNQYGRGRPRGSKNKSTQVCSELLEQNAQLLIRKCIFMAAQGDRVALRLCLERLLPARRAQPVRFAKLRARTAAQIADSYASLLGDISAGRLTPDEGQHIAGILESQRKALETADLERRLEALEQKAGSREESEDLWSGRGDGGPDHPSGNSSRWPGPSPRDGDEPEPAISSEADESGGDATGRGGSEEEPAQPGMDDNEDHTGSEQEQVCHTKRVSGAQEQFDAINDLFFQRSRKRSGTATSCTVEKTRADDNAVRDEGHQFPSCLSGRTGSRNHRGPTAPLGQHAGARAGADRHGAGTKLCAAGRRPDAGHRRREDAGRSPSGGGRRRVQSPDDRHSRKPSRAVIPKFMAKRWRLKSRQWEKQRALERELRRPLSSVTFMPLRRHRPAPVAAGRAVVVDHQEEITAMVQWRYRAAEGRVDTEQVEVLPTGIWRKGACVAHAQYLRPVPLESALLKGRPGSICSVPYCDEQARCGKKRKRRSPDAGPVTGRGHRR